VVDLLLEVFEAAMHKAPNLDAAEAIFQDLKVGVVDERTEH